MSKKNVLLIAIKRASAFLLMLLIVCAFLCGCAYQRPEFDEVRITYEYQDGEQIGHMSAPIGEVVKKTIDPIVMDELWNMYADLKVTDSNPPQGFPRYRIEFLNRGEVVDQWGISYNFVVNGKRFGLGNHVIKGTKLESPEFVGDSTIYNRIAEIFENCDAEATEYVPADNFDNSSKDAEFLEFEDINDLIATIGSVENSVGAQSAPKDTVDNLGDANISSRLPVPYYKNAEFPLRNASNLSNIMLEISSVFGHPMIWYYGKIDGVNVIVSVGVVPSEVVAQVDGEGIIKLKELHAEILKKMPTNPESAEITESISSMNLGGENRTVFITQYSDDPRCHIELLIEDIYVKIYAYPETINGGVLSDISIRIVRPANKSQVEILEIHVRKNGRT